MIPPVRDESCSGKPTPEMLAGITIRIEAEEDMTVRAHKPPQAAACPATDGTHCPGTDQLAGIYVLVEADEDLTVRPRKVSESARQS